MRLSESSATKTDVWSRTLGSLSPYVTVDKEMDEYVIQEKTTFTSFLVQQMSNYILESLPSVSVISFFLSIGVEYWDVTKA